MRHRVFSTLNRALPYVLSEFRSRGPCECKEGSTPPPSSSDRALFLDVVAPFDSPPISSLSAAAAADGEDGCATWVSDLTIEMAITPVSNMSMKFSSYPLPMGALSSAFFCVFVV